MLWGAVRTKMMWTLTRNQLEKIEAPAPAPLAAPSPALAVAEMPAPALQAPALAVAAAPVAAPEPALAVAAAPVAAPEPALAVAAAPVAAPEPALAVAAAPVAPVVVEAPAPARARVPPRSNPRSKREVPAFEDGGPLFVENADRATANAVRAYNAGLGWSFGIHSGFKRFRA
jgi:hypothetical protein